MNKLLKVTLITAIMATSGMAYGDGYYYAPYNQPMQYESCEHVAQACAFTALGFMTAMVAYKMLFNEPIFTFNVVHTGSITNDGEITHAGQVEHSHSGSVSYESGEAAGGEQEEADCLRINPQGISRDQKLQGTLSYSNNVFSFSTQSQFTDLGSGPYGLYAANKTTCYKIASIPQSGGGHYSVSMLDANTVFATPDVLGQEESEPVLASPSKTKTYSVTFAKTGWDSGSAQDAFGSNVTKNGVTANIITWATAKENPGK